MYFITATVKSVGLVAGLHLVPQHLYLPHPFLPCLLIIIIGINESGSRSGTVVDCNVAYMLLCVIYLLFSGFCIYDYAYG